MTEKGVEAYVEIRGKYLKKLAENARLRERVEELERQMPKTMAMPNNMFTGFQIIACSFLDRGRIIMNPKDMPDEWLENPGKSAEKGEGL